MLGLILIVGLVVGLFCVSSENETCISDEYEKLKKAE